MMRVLLVDDEEFARERLRQLLAAQADVEVVGEAADGEQAIAQVLSLRPDLLLLDIQMPGASGLEVAASLPRPRPGIIFCTAFDQYAVDAFDLEAVDYLLKPVNRIRLARALDRVRCGENPPGDDALDRVTRSVHGPVIRLLARCGDRYRVIPQREAIYLSSSGGLTRLHTNEREYVLDPTLNDLEALLDAALFYRISRSALVNLDYVAEVGPLCAGSADVMLRGGTRLEVSRRRLKELMERIAGSAGGVRPSKGPR
ncbi:MAG: LytTR family DNA-binding domain-containing protein [Paludibaculum sp.]